jgi:hypothetical protein
MSLKDRAWLSGFWVLGFGFFLSVSATKANAQLQFSTPADYPRH